MVKNKNRNLNMRIVCLSAIQIIMIFAFNNAFAQYEEEFNALNPLFKAYDSLLTSEMKECIKNKCEGSIPSSDIHWCLPKHLRTRAINQPTDTVISNWFKSPELKCYQKEINDIFESEIENAANKSYYYYLNNNKGYLDTFRVRMNNIRSEQAEMYRISAIERKADSLDNVYIPRNIGESIKILDEILQDSTKSRLKNYKSEYDLISKEHLNIGMGLRNYWRLVCSRYTVYFNERGIFEPDRMSTIILKAYYRHLNKRELKLKSLFEEAWKRYDEELQNELKKLTFKDENGNDLKYE
jgi:uncharacterized protein YnzC (UPF0291/DUF896 family)